MGYWASRLPAELDDERTQGTPEGPPGVSSLNVLDGAGNLLGIPWDFNFFFNEDLGLSMGRPLALEIWAGAVQSLVFEFPGCEGQAYAATDRFPAFLVGPTSSGFPTYFVTTTQKLTDVSFASHLRPNGCSPDESGIRPAVLIAEPFTGSLPLTVPVPEPIYVDLAP